MNIPSQLSVCAAALYHHVDFSQSNANKISTTGGTKRRRHQDESRTSLSSQCQSIVIHDIIPAATLYYLFPPHSVASLLRPCSKILRQWPKIISKQRLTKLPKWLTGEIGPFGYGCGKICEVICAYILLSFQHTNYEKESTRATATMLRTLPEALQLGPMPSFNAWLIVVLLSISVNLVLSLWSKITQSKGNYEGVDAMVKDTIDRRMSTSEHLALALMALGNAVCEESVSRGFYYHEFVVSAGMSRNAANIAQAAAFGVWHYNGIPSGFTGVGLTFVYGLVMGLLKDFGGGLLLPIATHAIADYYIFSIVVRNKAR